MTLAVTSKFAVSTFGGLLLLEAQNQTSAVVKVNGVSLLLPDGRQLAFIPSTKTGVVWSHPTPASLQPNEIFKVVFPLASLQHMLDAQNIPRPLEVQARFHNASGNYVSSPVTIS